MDKQTMIDTVTANIADSLAAFIRPYVVDAVNKAMNVESKVVVSSKIQCPHNEILKIWAEVMPDKSQPRIWDGANKKNLEARWHAGFVMKKHSNGDVFYSDLDDGLKFWRSFFKYLRKSEFLMEQCKPFSLGWVVKKDNFIKIYNGQYHHKD